VLVNLPTPGSLVGGFTRRGPHHGAEDAEVRRALLRLGHQRERVRPLAGDLGAAHALIGEIDGAGSPVDH